MSKKVVKNDPKNLLIFKDFLFIISRVKKVMIIDTLDELENLMLITALGAFLGALLTLLVSIYIEFQRKPKLYFTIEDPPSDQTYTSAPAKHARFVRVHLRNKAIPKPLIWLSRHTAMHCHGEINFYHISDAAPVFSKPMPIRWSESDEPLSPQLLNNGQLIQVFDPAKYNAAFYRNCYPGSKESIDIACRFDNDEDCYGWSNESYLPSKGWRNQDWKLPKGRYYVSITIHSSGDKVVDVFKLDNFTTIDHFRLMKVPSNERNKLAFA